MNRRGFLSLLGLSGAGLVMGRSLPIPAPVIEAPPVLVLPSSMAFGNTLITPAWMVKEVARSFKQALGHHKVTYRPGEQRGLTERLSHSAWTSADWYHLAEYDKPIDADWTLDEMRRRVLRPAGEGLAERFKRDGLRVMGDAALPIGGVTAVRITSKDQGVSLLAVQQYDVTKDRTLMRFSYLAGH